MLVSAAWPRPDGGLAGRGRAAGQHGPQDLAGRAGSGDLGDAVTVAQVLPASSSMTAHAAPPPAASAESGSIDPPRLRDRLGPRPTPRRALKVVLGRELAHSQTPVDPDASCQLRLHNRSEVASPAGQSRHPEEGPVRNLRPNPGRAGGVRRAERERWPLDF